LQRPIAGGAGKVWSTLCQYSDLIETTENEPDNPGVPLLTRFHEGEGIGPCPADIGFAIPEPTRPVGSDQRIATDLLGA